MSALPWVIKGFQRATDGRFGTQAGPHGGKPATDMRPNADLDAAFADEPAKPKPAPAGDPRRNTALDEFMAMGDAPPARPSGPPALPHHRSEQAAQAAAKAVVQAARGGGDVKAAHGQAMAALDTHLKAGLAELDRRGGDPRQKQAFARKLSVARAKLNQLAGVDHPRTEPRASVKRPPVRRPVVPPAVPPPRRGPRRHKGVSVPWLAKAAHDVIGESRDEAGKWTAGSAAGKDKPLHEMTRAKVRAAAPDKPPPTEDNLEDIADALRQAMDEAVGSPKDQCIATAHALKTLYPEAEIWEGTVGGESHTLAKLGGKFLDVTADQFGGWDEVQVLDPADLPKAYRRFRNITSEHDPSKSQWKTQAAITDALRVTLRESSESSAQSTHVYAVHDAKKAGKAIPKEVLADFPELNKAFSPDESFKAFGGFDLAIDAVPPWVIQTKGTR